MAERGRSGSINRKQSERIMARERLKEKERNTENKECIRCEFTGKLNDDRICRRCEEEVKDQHEVCPKCKHWVEDGGVECSICKSWCHLECEGLKEADLKVVKSMRDWFCVSCAVEWKREKRESALLKEELMNIKRKNIELQNKMESVESKLSWSQEVEDLEENNPEEKSTQREEENKNEVGQKADRKSEKGKSICMDREMVIKIWEEIRQLKKDNKSLRETIENMEKKWEIREERLVKKIKETAVESLREIQEKEKRKKNIVMFNVPESKNDEGGEREAEEENKMICESIFHNALKVKDAKIERSYRIGTVKQGKVRPLVVEMNEVGVKWAIIAKGKTLAKCEDITKRDIYIVPDLTYTEREENYRLRKELKEKREQGGKWIIKKGRIVQL